MSSFELLKQQVEGMGLKGKELFQYITHLQEMEREEQRAKREALEEKEKKKELQKN